MRGPGRAARRAGRAAAPGRRSRGGRRAAGRPRARASSRSTSPCANVGRRETEAPVDRRLRHGEPRDRDARVGRGAQLALEHRAGDALAPVRRRDRHAADRPHRDAAAAGQRHVGHPGIDRADRLGDLERGGVVHADEAPEREAVARAAELLVALLTGEESAHLGLQVRVEDRRRRRVDHAVFEAARGDGVGGGAVGGGVLPVVRGHAPTLSSGGGQRRVSPRARLRGLHRRGAVGRDQPEPRAAVEQIVRPSARPRPRTPQRSSCAVTPRAAAGPSGSVATNGASAP